MFVQAVGFSKQPFYTVSLYSAPKVPFWYGHPGLNEYVLRKICLQIDEFDGILGNGLALRKNPVDELPAFKLFSFGIGEVHGITQLPRLAPRRGKKNGKSKKQGRK